MNVLLFSALLGVCVYGYTLEGNAAAFEAFKTKYGKTYTYDEEAKRSAIFQENLKSIEEHNALYQQGLVSWTKGVTKFADMTQDEYKSTLALKESKIPKMSRNVLDENLKAPDSFDWRELGAVTPIKEEGSCQASWAFAVAATVEGAYFVKSGQLVSLSTQQLIDCSSEYGNEGCEGGYLGETMPYIEFQGIQSEESYPYEGKDGQCQYNSSAVVTKIRSWVHFLNNQYELLQAVANYGPVAASLDASEIKDYTGGIYVGSSCGTFSPSLGVAVVGYGSENGTNYWIAKTPLGTSWGEEGYLRIEREANTMACGLYRQTVYPLID